MKTVTLYRPVGLKEWALIRNSGYTAFPPRLSWQPIFYPVLNIDYAAQIASEWNTQDAFSGYCGIVTQFELNERHYQRYEVQNVGAELHNELWVPAEELPFFNENIAGSIHAIKLYKGPEFIIPEDAGFASELLKLIGNELQ